MMTELSFFGVNGLFKRNDPQCTSVRKADCLTVFFPPLALEMQFVCFQAQVHITVLFRKKNNLSQLPATVSQCL